MSRDNLLIILAVIGSALCWWPATIEPSLDFPRWLLLALIALMTALATALSDGRRFVIASTVGTFTGQCSGFALFPLSDGIASSYIPHAKTGTVTLFPVRKPHRMLMVMDADVPVIEHGGAGDFQYAQHWTPTKVDRILHDSSKVELGGMELTAHLTPGHTKGCTTWTMEVKDAGRKLHVVIVGGPNVNTGYRLVNNRQYPRIAADYEQGFRVLHSLPCEIFLGAHGSYFDMDEKLKRPKPGVPNPFIDAAGYRAYIEDRERAFREEWAAQKTKTVVSR